MKSVLIAAALAVASGTAQAAIPAFSVTCGKKTEVKAAAGGPIMINGKEVKITSEKDGNYYEIVKGKATYAVTVGAADAVTVTVTKKGKTDTCTAKAA